MAISDAYASVDDYRVRMQRSDNGADTQIARDMLAVSRYIDRITGYTRTGFSKDASDVTRVLYAPKGNRNSQRLEIDPLSAAPTSVTVDTDWDGDFSDETALTLTQFTGDVRYEPGDYASGPEPRPITALVLTPWNSALSSWPSGAAVQIVGKWGWPEVPEMIRSACIELTGILRLESPRATEQITEIGEVTRMSGDAQKIIHGLTRTYRKASVLL